MSCDICGKNDKELIMLRDCYQTVDIKQICSDCERIVDKKQSKLLTVALKITGEWLKQFMREERKLN